MRVIGQAGRRITAEVGRLPPQRSALIPPSHTYTYTQWSKCGRSSWPANRSNTAAEVGRPAFKPSESESTPESPCVLLTGQPGSLRTPVAPWPWDPRHNFVKKKPPGQIPETRESPRNRSPRRSDCPVTGPTADLSRAPQRTGHGPRSGLATGPTADWSRAPHRPGSPPPPGASSLPISVTPRPSSATPRSRSHAARTRSPSRGGDPANPGDSSPEGDPAPPPRDSRSAQDGGPRPVQEHRGAGSGSEPSVALGSPPTPPPVFSAVPPLSPIHSLPFPRRAPAPLRLLRPPLPHSVICLEGRCGTHRRARLLPAGPGTFAATRDPARLLPAGTGRGSLKTCDPGGVAGRSKSAGVAH